MNAPHDHLPFDDDLLPEEREALLRALAEDPALRKAFLRWERLRETVRRRLDAAVPDRRVLVFCGMEEAGRADALSADERQALASARADLDRALESHPGLSDVVRDAGAACRDFERAWATHFEPSSAETKPAADRAPRRRGGSGRVRQWAWRVGGGLAVLAFAAVALMLAQRDRSFVTVRVADGETRTVELSDGSTVRLVGAAELAYVDPEREATLDRYARLVGQGFFDILPGRAGFTIETPSARTTVLGTRLGIRADEVSTEVVLASGRATVASAAAPDRPVVLEPGQMIRVAAGALPTTPAPVDIAEELAWTGLFVFQGATLGEIAARLSAHYEVAVQVAQELRGEPVTGTFEQDQPVGEILDVLADALGASVRHLPEGGYLLAP